MPIILNPAFNRCEITSPVRLFWIQSGFNMANVRSFNLSSPYVFIAFTIYYFHLKTIFRGQGRSLTLVFNYGNDTLPSGFMNSIRLIMSTGIEVRPFYII